MKNYFFYFLLIFQVGVIPLVYAQEPPQVNISERVVTRDGKTFRVHIVERGQNLYRISKTYDVPIAEITRYNPDAAIALKPGMELLIPYGKTDEDKTPTSYIYHVTRKGETLDEIAAIYGVSKESLLNLNPELNGSKPVTGQSIKIPMDYSGAIGFKPDTINRLPGQEFKEHLVAEKETLYSISKQYKVTIADIIEWNPFVQDGLKAGQIIRIGKSTAVPKISDFTEYRVQKKESLYGIARAHRISIDSLKLFNPGLTEQIKEGQIIFIPKKGASASYITHIASSRETIDKIAEKYQIDKQQIVEANPDLGAKVKKNTQVKIPVEKKVTLPETPEPVAELPAVEAISSSNCGKSYKFKDEEFNIVILFPYPRQKMAQGVKTKASEKQRFKYLSFYEGILIAVDSLEKEGLKARITALDAGYDPEDTRRLLNNPALKNANLIIALAFSKNFSLLAEFAKKHEIPIINVLSKKDEILVDNPFVIRAYPSADYQTERILGYLKQRPQKQNIVLLRSNKYQHQNSYTETEKSLYGCIAAGEFPNGCVITSIGDTISKLNESLKYNYHNYLIAYSENEAFSINLLRNLHNSKDTLRYSVIGLPSWENMKNIENQLVASTDLHFVTPWFVDYTSLAVQGFVGKYRDRFNIEPDDLAMIGFDMMWFAGHSLMMEGKNFLPCLENIRVNGILSQYQFKNKNDDGYVNTFWNIYHYPGFRPVLLNR
ncbi:MAG: hypothetical protein PWR20_2209 [Bacteroidales bacterium]|jgi:LysM repeat protein|nr:hypothetical protein [Bacteroidales bacterium]MDN5329741.1 hypothetical protein [Bacteroidales bacterium]